MKHRSIQAGFASFALMFVALFTPAAKAQGGADLFKSKCAACHGSDGSANTAAGKSMKIRDLHSSDVQKQTDGELTEIISAGKGTMPSYKGKLTEIQIGQLVSYIRDLAKK